MKKILSFLLLSVTIVAIVPKASAAQDDPGAYINSINSAQHFRT